MELKAKEQELKATETRLNNMEQDLIEMSMANDEYRSQVKSIFKNFTLLKISAVCKVFVC